jgi:hypothetical protein
MSGEISQAQFQENVAARGAAALAGVSIIVPGPEDLAISALARNLTGRLRGRAARLASRLAGGTDEAIDSARAATTVEDLLQDAASGRVTKGRSKLFSKPGGLDKANESFDALKPTNIRALGGGGRVGYLEDGRKVVLRPTSSRQVPPTLEIQAGKNRIKIRFEDAQ